jgi:hypothetical protein
MVIRNRVGSGAGEASRQQPSRSVDSCGWLVGWLVPRQQASETPLEGRSANTHPAVSTPLLVVPARAQYEGNRVPGAWERVVVRPRLMPRLPRLNRLHRRRRQRHQLWDG